MTLNFKNVDSSIESFYKLLPYGNYFSEAVYSLKIDYEEQEKIKKYLVDNDIITDYTDDKDGRYIMTPHGQEIFNDYGGIEKYNEHQKEKQEEKLRLEKKANDKLHDDAKLSKWQVKTFWPVFVFGLIGFIFGVFNFVDSRIKTKSIEELQQDNRNIQEEVSRLHTLVLDPKTVDSLHNSKTQIDALRPR
jgi:predicted transcriptional regulator